MERPLRVLLVAEHDSRTGTLRRGPSLRLAYAPQGVSYDVFNGSPFHRVPQSYTIDNISDLLQVLKYAIGQLGRRALRPVGDGYDLVHSFFFDLTRYRGRWIYEGDQSVSQHMRYYMRAPKELYSLITKYFVGMFNSESCGAVVTWTSWAMKGFIEDGVDRSKVFVVPPPMPVGRPKPHDGINVLFIGRDPVRKGLDLILRPIVRVASYFNNVRALVVAPGLGRRSMLGGRVRVVSSVPEDVLRSAVMPTTDVVLAPSRAEAYNLTVLEAMAYGAVPITSTAGGLPELVGDSGLIVDDLSEEGFEDALEEVVSDEALRLKLSYRARELVKSRHDPELVGQELYKVYIKSVEQP